MCGFYGPSARPCGVDLSVGALLSYLFALGQLNQTTSEAGASSERGRARGRASGPVKRPRSA